MLSSADQVVEIHWNCQALGLRRKNIVKEWKTQDQSSSFDLKVGLIWLLKSNRKRSAYVGIAKRVR